MIITTGGRVRERRNSLGSTVMIGYQGEMVFWHMMMTIIWIRAFGWARVNTINLNLRRQKMREGCMITSSILAIRIKMIIDS